MAPFIPTIGLEVHVQLKTRSKMFCGCAVEFGTDPNRHTCPVCLGYPGALPVMNEKALRLTALTGLMLGCEVAAVCKFDRKNYFYPDMPKNYQITQYDQPICLGGAVPLHDLSYPRDARPAGAAKSIALTRIHLEEDVAKSFHFETSTGIDFNRAGTPLMEIVSEPEIATPEEAFAYLTSLQQILIYGGVSDADMEKGQLRCDCNVSVRPVGQEELGTKIEIKNMNTISGVRRALAFEIERQTEALRTGRKLHQETRRWDDDSGQTFAMRTKESAHDYRYFPDPDLLPVETGVFMDEVRAQRPELPAEKRERFVQQYGVTPYDAGELASDLPLAHYFETAAGSAKKPKSVANWVLNDLRSALAAGGLAVAECPLAPEGLDELVNLIEAGTISSKQGKEVFAEMFATGKAAGAVVEEKGLRQESDPGALEALCRQAIEGNPKAVAEFHAGKAASINFLKGQVMKFSQGKGESCPYRRGPSETAHHHPMKKSVCLLALALAATPAFAETKRGHRGSASGGLPPKFGGLIQPAPLTDVPAGLITSDMSGRDLEFLSGAIAKGREQVWLCELATDKTSNEQVREVGKVFKSTQEEEIARLQQLAAKKGLSVPAAAVSPDQKKLATKLGGLAGGDFDKAIMDQIIASAQAAIGSYEGASKSEDTDIRTIAERLLPVSKDKVPLAYQITGRNPDGTPRPLFRTKASPVATTVPPAPRTPMAPPPAVSTTPMSTPTPMATPKPMATPMATPKPMATPMATPKPMAPPMGTPKPLATPMATPAPKPMATPMATPAPAATPAPRPLPATPAATPAAHPMAATPSANATPVPRPMSATPPAATPAAKSTPIVLPPTIPTAKPPMMLPSATPSVATPPPARPDGPKPLSSSALTPAVPAATPAAPAK